MQKKKILFVIPYMSEGGAQRALSNIQSGLDEFFEIETLVNSEINRVYPNKGRVISLNIDKKARVSSVIFQICAFAKRTIILGKLKKSGKYCAVISFVDSTNIANIITKWCGEKKGTKTIISVRTSISEAAKRIPQYKYIVNPIARLLYKRADTIVSVSDELRGQLIRDYHFNRNKVVTIQNGFDRMKILEKSAEDIDENLKERIANKRIVLTAGRLNVAKNQWHLIRAFSKVLVTCQDVILIIAGGGELEDYLKRVALAAGMDDDVLFLGSERNVYRYMRISEVFVLPSSFEGFPNALGEALCLGVPCVSTDFRTGAREILAPEMSDHSERIDKVRECQYGIITPVCSGKMYNGNEPLEYAETELANAIIGLLDKSDLNGRYRSKSIERGKDFDIGNTVQKWKDVIEDKRWDTAI